MSALRDFLKVYWPLVAVAFAGVLLALMLMDPAPPKTIRFAAGSPGGAYHAFAERYQRLLAEEGVEVELVETQGSIDNLRLLDDSEVDVGLVQGGLSTPRDEEKLRSLGGLFPEPFWVFVRKDVEAETLGDLRNLRMAVGGQGAPLAPYLDWAIFSDPGQNRAGDRPEPRGPQCPECAII